MKIRYILAAALALSLVLSANTLACESEDDGAVYSGSTMEVAAMEPSVVITSPKDGDTVGSKVEVKWKLEKANKAAHVHFYLDGKNLGPKQGDYFTLTDLKPGKHTIELHPATSSHDEIGTGGGVTITVK